MTRRELVANKMAEALIEFMHLFYNRETAKGVLKELIRQLEVKVKEFE